MTSPAVSDAMVEVAIDAWENVYEAELHIGSPTYTDNKEIAMRAALAAAIGAGGQAVANDDGSMTPEEIRLENLKQMAAYDGPIVSFECREPYYLASCDHCGWVGSSELCGTDNWGDDSDVYCPRCHTSGADCGKVASALSQPHPADERVVEALREAVAWIEHHHGYEPQDIRCSDCRKITGWRAALSAKEGQS